MVVQHNLTAMNSNRQLGVITSSQSKSAEKLSSGYKINRAGDDAAGLKISEKMRSQIRGLNKASTNAQDGVSLIQTAEGALNEAHSILQRMNELAVQGANDTNQNIDREAINEELDALVKELDRISETTQFNKQELLDGSFQNKNLHVGANANQKIEISIDNMNAETLGLKSVTVTSTTLEDKQKGEKYTTATYEGITYSYDINLSMSKNLSAAIAAIQKGLSAKYTSSLYVQQGDGTWKGLEASGSFSSVASAISADRKAVKSAASAALRTGFSSLLKKEETTASKALSTTTTTTGNVSVSNYDAANASITAIQDAINKVSTQRSALGALQNRLEHTIANLDNVAENTQAAESRIRDTDMASEMVEYSKNQILAQAGQAMLAQGNQSTQGVLSLLQ
ncbi:flagellin [Lachnospiraceae bacterium 29-84]